MFGRLLKGSHLAKGDTARMSTVLTVTRCVVGCQAACDVQ